MNMASSSSPLLLMIIFSMSLLISCSESTEYLLGDSHNSWKVPLPSRRALAHWASAYEFTVGDTIRFEYDNETESVHEVDEHDYIMCHTNGEHVEHHDGNTTVVLDKIGVYHFISGTKSHCKMGLKLAVIVKNKHDLVLPPLITMPMPPSPSPSPNSSGNKGGGGGAGLGFIMWLGVNSLVMMIFLI